LLSYSYLLELQQVHQPCWRPAASLVLHTGGIHQVLQQQMQQRSPWPLQQLLHALLQHMCC
jgi:hypothetical protein